MNSRTFVEIPLFTRKILEIADDGLLGKLQQELMQNPEKGDLIPRLHGLRKVRMALSGKGKQGGARVIYYYFLMHNKIVLCYAYTKAEAENITPEQERKLKALVDVLKAEYNHEKT